MRRIVSTAGALFAVAVALAPARAQNATPALDAEAKHEVVASLLRELEQSYVFPEIAARMGADLSARLRDGAYDAVAEPAALAALVTEHLQAVSRDKHLRVRFGEFFANAAPAAAPVSRPAPFGRAERLDGDIAYVEILSFGHPADAVRDRTRDIMTAAADAAALIIDVRANGGGSPEFVALVSSYLFGDEPVHLNSLYFRPADRTDDFYTDPNVSGEKFGPDKPVYVLTSGRTFSAAEEFTYNLQSLERAVIVGETTGGGAHPGGVVRLPHGFTAFIPSGRAINPITKTNWEGTGVRPDVAVPADAALETSLDLARKAASR